MAQATFSWYHKRLQLPSANHAHGHAQQLQSQHDCNLSIASILTKKKKNEEEKKKLYRAAVGQQEIENSPNPAAGPVPAPVPAHISILGIPHMTVYLNCLYMFVSMCVSPCLCALIDCSYVALSQSVERQPKREKSSSSKQKNRME